MIDCGEIFSDVCLNVLPSHRCSRPEMVFKGCRFCFFSFVSFPLLSSSTRVTSCFFHCLREDPKTSCQLRSNKAATFIIVYILVPPRAFIHEDYGVGETSSCRRHVRQQSTTTLQGMFFFCRKFVWVLVRWTVAQWSSCPCSFFGPDIRPHRTQYGLEMSATTWRHRGLPEVG